MNKRIISIYTNNTKASKDTYGLLKDKLESNGFEVRDDYHASVELLVTIGGDGATLQAIQKYDFPDVPIIGINTGHLGFFQEISPDQLDEFIHNYKAKKFSAPTDHCRSGDGPNTAGRICPQGLQRSGPSRGKFLYRSL